MGFFRRREACPDPVNVEAVVVEVTKLHPVPGDVLLFTLNPDYDDDDAVGDVAAGVFRALGIEPDGDVKAMFLQGIKVEVVRLPSGDARVPGSSPGGPSS